MSFKNLSLSIFFFLFIANFCLAMEVEPHLEPIDLPGLHRPVSRFKFFQNRLAVLFQDSSEPSFFDLGPSQTMSKTSPRSAFFVQYLTPGNSESKNKKLVIWEISSGKKLITIPIDNRLEKYTINNAGDTIAIYYWDGIIEFYKIHDHAKIVPFHRSQLEINKYTWGRVFAFSPDDEFLILNERCMPRGYSAWIGATSVLDGKTGELLWEKDEYFNNGIQLSKDKQKILLHSWRSPNNIIEVKLRTGEVLQTFDIGSNPLDARPSYWTDLRLASIYGVVEDLQIFDIGYNRRSEALPHGQPDKVLYGIDDSVLVFYRKYNTLYTFRTNHSTEPYEIFWHHQPQPIENIYVSSSKKYTALERPKKTNIIDVKNNSNLFNFDGNFMLFSPDESLMVIGNDIIDIESRKVIHHFENFEIGIFSDDSKFFAKIRANYLISIWAVKNSSSQLTHTQI